MRTRLTASSGMPQTEIINGTESDSESIGGSDLGSDCSGASAESGLNKNATRSKRTNVNLPVDLSQMSVKKGVDKVLKSVKQLDKNHSIKMPLVAFLELIQGSYYQDVSLVLLGQFIAHHMIMPKAIYAHYYIYFLHYAEYYHYVRCTTDIIDTDRVEFHQQGLANIKEHIKYVYHIINRRRSNPP